MEKDEKLIVDILKELVIESQQQPVVLNKYAKRIIKETKVDTSFVVDAVCTNLGVVGHNHPANPCCLCQGTGKIQDDLPYDKALDLLKLIIESSPNPIYYNKALVKVKNERV